MLLRWHDLFTFLGLSSGSGLNWSLSIIFLVITARVALFRFFLKQVHYQRNMQEMQPRLQAIKEKYKNDRQAQQREMMRLQQEEGFNPLTGCLPMLLQIPIFISLFHVLRHLSNSGRSVREPPVHQPEAQPLQLHPGRDVPGSHGAVVRRRTDRCARRWRGRYGTRPPTNRPNARRSHRDSSGDHRAGRH